MEDTKQKIVEMLQFINEEIESNVGLDEEQRESLNVAIQCLETAYNIKEHELATSLSSNSEKTSWEIQAETLKAKGNLAMQSSNYTEAIAAYSKAIELNPKNPVYYSNRAAAYSKLEKHQDAVRDCQEAIRVDPTYSKAYGRLGNGYFNLGCYREAKQAYCDGLKYDPDNQSYKDKIKLCEEQISFQGERSPGNISNLLSDFNILNLTSQLLSDSDITLRDVMSNLVTTAPGQEQNAHLNASLNTIAELFTTGQSNVDQNTLDSLFPTLNNNNSNNSSNNNNNNRTSRRNNDNRDANN